MGDIATEAATQITAVQAEILTVGAAIIALAAVALGIRWIKAVFF